MEASDFLRLAHPVVAVTVVFPLIGMTVFFAWQTRQRRLSSLLGGTSQIPAMVGKQHRQLGNTLTNAVVGLSLLGLAHPITKTIIQKQLWNKNLFQVVFIILIFIATIASLVFLNKSKQRIWRAIFATLTGAGVIILGCQDGVFRRTNVWYWSHYYIGIAAAMLMIFSVSIIPDIYQDKKNRWRMIHVILNCIALLLFLGQGITGTRDLLEIPLGWQESYIYKCDFENKICPTLEKK